MKYRDLVNFDPIVTIIQLTSANSKENAINLIKTYVMSDDMADKLINNMLSQLQMEDVVDNKGVLLIGNYGTGKSHLMSVISAIAEDEENLKYLNNKNFAEAARVIAGKFEVLRIEIGATRNSLRNIIFSKIQEDFKNRGLNFDFPDEKEIVSNKEVFREMMNTFATKYGDKGYLIIVDELLDYLGSRKTQEVKYDLGFMRELGEIVKDTRIRVIFGLQQLLFDNPDFTFVAQTLSRVKDRYEQVIIRKEDTAYVVSERILKKTPQQKAIIREHLQKFSSLYTNMSERMDEFVDLYPIHPSYIDIFNKIYIAEHRHILKNITTIIDSIINMDIDEDSPGIISFDTYWPFIKNNFSYRSDSNIKEVVEKSDVLENIINRSFTKPSYKPLAIQIIYALSVYRLATGDITVKAGLTVDNLRDDLCLFIKNLPDRNSDTLKTFIQVVLKEIMTTVSGQFIDYNPDNGQYYLDLKKNIDYEEIIARRAEKLTDDEINNFYYEIIYACLDWQQPTYKGLQNIYEHRLNWASHNIFRTGYLFFGSPEERPTAQPPEDYYIYFLRPYNNGHYYDEKKDDEVFFVFKPTEEFTEKLRLYGGAITEKNLSTEQHRQSYNTHAEKYKRELARFLRENINTCFDVIYKGVKKQLIEVIRGHYKGTDTFKEIIDIASSLCLDEYFTKKYPEMPIFKTPVTYLNRREIVGAALNCLAGKKNQLGLAVLESFGLYDGDKITTEKSKYAQYYIKELKNIPSQAVINFSDIFVEVENKDEYFVDKKFQISYILWPIVFVAMVYTGDAVIALKDGRILTATELESLVNIEIINLYEFKYIAKPKGLPLKELCRLFELLELSPALIVNANEREKGLEKLLQKADSIVRQAVDANLRITSDFELWGEPLIAKHIVEEYKKAIKHGLEVFNNFSTKFNTVAKLNNFAYSIDVVEQLGKDIEIVKIVNEYYHFKNELTSIVTYLMNIEGLNLSQKLKDDIEDAKAKFRQIRDDIPEEKNGKLAANNVNRLLENVKNQYIDYYFEEHNKRRLNYDGAKRKGDIISSQKFNNLKRLRSINILSTSKLDNIEKELSDLKVCTELTPDILKNNYYCTKCSFKIGDNEVIVKGRLDQIEDKIDDLIDEWTMTLLNTITDPTLENHKQFLTSDQRAIINMFVETKSLPEKVDQYFVNAIQELLEGFEPVFINSDELIDKLSSLGPCDVDTLQSKLNDILNQYTIGKDKEKLRIIIKK